MQTACSFGDRRRWCCTAKALRGVTSHSLFPKKLTCFRFPPHKRPTGQGRCYAVISWEETAEKEVWMEPESIKKRGRGGCSADLLSLGFIFPQLMLTHYGLKLTGDKCNFYCDHAAARKY